MALLAQAQDFAIMPCKVCTVPSLIGMSYDDAVTKWNDQGFIGPVFPNIWCETEDSCPLRVVEQSTPAGTVECFYAPIAVIMQ